MFGLKVLPWLDSALLVVLLGLGWEVGMGQGGKGRFGHQETLMRPLDTEVFLVIAK